MRRGRPWLVAAVAAVMVAILAVSLLRRESAATNTGEPGHAVVVHVVDGDTLVAKVGGSEESVRLIGIDTPESVARDRPVECFGAEASQRLKDLLPQGASIRLERDLEPRDRYDRLLAYVHRLDDGLFVNLDQVANGYAEASEYPPNTARSTELAAAQSSARAAHAGLWGVCD